MSFLTDLVAWILTHWSGIGLVAASLVALASAITALTPTPEDDKWVRRIAGWLSFLMPRNAEGTLKAPLTPLPRADEPLVTDRTDGEGRGGAERL